jgi:hypothetical protein
MHVGSGDLFCESKGQCSVFLSVSSLLSTCTARQRMFRPGPMDARKVQGASLSILTPTAHPGYKKEGGRANSLLSL